MEDIALLEFPEKVKKIRENNKKFEQKLQAYETLKEANQKKLSEMRSGKRKTKAWVSLRKKADRNTLEGLSETFLTGVKKKKNGKGNLEAPASPEVRRLKSITSFTEELDIEKKYVMDLFKNPEEFVDLLRKLEEDDLSLISKVHRLEEELQNNKKKSELILEKLNKRKTEMEKELQDAQNKENSIKEKSEFVQNRISITKNPSSQTLQEEDQISSCYFKEKAKILQKINWLAQQFNLSSGAAQIGQDFAAALQNLKLLQNYFEKCLKDHSEFESEHKKDFEEAKKEFTKVKRARASGLVAQEKIKFMREKEEAKLEQEARLSNLRKGRKIMFKHVLGGGKKKKIADKTEKEMNEVLERKYLLDWFKPPILG